MGRAASKTACGSAFLILTGFSAKRFYCQIYCQACRCRRQTAKEVAPQAHRTKLSLRTSINTYHERNPFSVLHVINSRERIQIPVLRASSDIQLGNLSHILTKIWYYTQGVYLRSEEHTSELQSPCNLVCRLLLEKKKI